MKSSTKFSALFTLIVNLIIIFLSKLEIVQAIVGGHRDETHTYRYHVSVQANDRHICGGALISDMHAVTAAICFIGEDELFIDNVYKVIAGVEDLTDKDKITALVEKIYIPRLYKRANGNSINNVYISPYDIAVLKFTEKLDFAQLARVSMALLPQKSSRYSKYSKETGIVTGYGVEDCRESDTHQSMTEVCENRCRHLKTIDSTVLLKRSCQAMIHQNIDNNHFCARVGHIRNSKSGLCYGDIGAPFISSSNTLIGILIKHRRDCNEDFLPSVYTSITSFLDFIETAKKDIDVPDSIRFATRRVSPTEGIVELRRFI